MGNIDFVESVAGEVVPLAQVAVRLHPRDDVAIAKVALQPGTTLSLASGAQVMVRDFVPSGHKVALRQTAAGDAVRRYGQVIGFASRAILAGEHVHTHNLGVHGFEREYAFGTEAQPVGLAPESERRTFLGYRRADGRVGTRNYIAVISSVNCSAHVTREIARHFTAERLAAQPNVDGVIAITHASGCGFQLNGPDYVLLQRCLAGIARHPNVGAYVLVGLGCEVNSIPDLVENCGLNCGGQSVPSLTIQEMGGIRKTIQAGIAAVESLLPAANVARRTPQPISGLMLAVQCGGSDGWSGVTANPVVGCVADEVVRQGGAVVLAETPEIYGAEHLLARRAIDAQVGEKLIAQVRWWEEHARLMGAELDDNPSAGNKAGGLTTIYEKALGAVAKGGSTPLMDVYDYAEPVSTRGLAFMNSPGYDPVSVTGQVAGGCNLVLFTTGRGSVFGFKPAPSIKICSNSATYHAMVDDMDFNAGKILEGAQVADTAAELLDLAIAVASGQPSKSEAQGVGEAEFNPWSLGGTL
jgi:altronate hydrolase